MQILTASPIADSKGYQNMISLSATDQLLITVRYLNKTNFENRLTFGEVTDNSIVSFVVKR